jgi:pyruvate/2-oxoglutarate dehydrogenase complex dihydrolipoamide dehydrogenase (E3) component
LLYSIKKIATTRIFMSYQYEVVCQPEVGVLNSDQLLRRALRKSIQSIYAAGDINGIGLLESIATAQARVAVDTILGKPALFNKHWFPRFLHTEPPIASVGWTEDEAKAAGLPVEAVSCQRIALKTDPQCLSF